MNIKMTGMVSGLDTDTIVSALVSAQRYKVTKLTKKKTQTEWKADAWKELNTKIYALYSGTLENLRFTSAYGAKATSISNASIADVSASTNAVDGTQSLVVKQLAKSGYMTGAKLETKDGSKLTEETTLSQLGYTGGDASFAIKVGNKETNISISGDTKLKDVVASMKKAGVSASFDVKNGRIFVNSKNSGEAGNFDFTATTGDGVAALQYLGLFAASDAANATYKEWAAYSGYGYVQGYSGADATQIAYNEKYEALVASKKAAYQSKIDSATEELQTIIEGYGVSTYEQYIEEVCKDASGQPMTAEGKLQELATSLENDKNSLQTATDEEKALQEQLNALNIATATAQKEQELRNNIAAKQAEIKALNTSIAENTALSNNLTTAVSLNGVIKDSTDAIDKVDTEVKNEMQARAAASQSALSALSAGYSAGAVKIAGQDAVIELNGAEFTSESNSFSINGLTILAKETSTYTTDDAGNITYNATSITTSDDHQATYDTIKKFFKEYNELIVEMDKLYNADSAKGYEPLSDEEKEAMTDDQIEKWETKIKDALLRKDNTLSEVSQAMKMVMGSSYEYKGTKYSLASFGIETGAYFTTEKNERGVYHIDGDKEDPKSSTNSDKLMSALATDKDAVVNFFTKLSGDLYNTMTKKMKSVQGVRTIYHVYNDQTLADQVDDYEDQIDKLEKKISALEERYYKEFSAMEVALQKLNQSSSSLSGLLGS